MLIFQIHSIEFHAPLNPPFSERVALHILNLMADGRVPRARAAFRVNREFRTSRTPSFGGLDRFFKTARDVESLATSNVWPGSLCLRLTIIVLNRRRRRRRKTSREKYAPAQAFDDFARRRRDLKNGSRPRTTSVDWDAFSACARVDGRKTRQSAGPRSRSDDESLNDGEK